MSLLLAGTACIGRGGGAAAPSTVTAAINLPTRATVNVPRPGAPAATTTTAAPALFEFVDFTRTGGLAGVHDHLKIFPDARAFYDDGATAVQFTVSPATVGDLRSALEQAELPALPANDTRPTAPDAFAYNLIYGGRSVRFRDGAVPLPLIAAFTILDRELARGRAMR